MSNLQIPTSLGLKAGEWVEVRSQAEILTTLDQNGRLDELPFMPQMLRYCGQKFQVKKRVHKLCCIVADTIGRQLTGIVSLEGLRCDGQDYGGCEMACTILWKEAWLRRLAHAGTGFHSVTHGEPVNALPILQSSGCSVADIMAGTRAPQDGTGASEPVYICQATQLPYATKPLSQWAMKQYYEDYVSGNVRLSQIISRLLFRIYYGLTYSGLGLGFALGWAYDVFQRLRGLPPYPWLKGALPKNGPTPSVDLNLQIGELVRVKDYSEIRMTIDENWKNRGMAFHPELSRHCGKSFRVLHRVRKLVNESTGQLMMLKNECLILDQAECNGEYTDPLNCPRGAYPYWRQIWLERVPENVCSSEGQAKLPSDQMGTSRS